MPRVTDTQTSFNSGELSGLLDGRTDTDIYTRGCRTLENFIPTTQGPATKRKGSKYVASVKDSGQESRLIPFVFSEIDSYIIELGQNYMRFYTEKAQVMLSGSPYEIATVFLQTELRDIKFRQIGDIMYLSHPNHPTQKLSRFGNTNWTIAGIDNKYGPTLDRDPDEVVTMQVTGTITEGGTVTATASASTFGTDDLGFQVDHIGSVWAFAEASNSLSPYAEWATGTVFAASTYVRRDGRLYFTSAGGTSGTFPPIHEDGTVSDGGVSWLFVNFAVGYAKMTARTSATVATFEVQRHLPPTIETTSPLFVATTYWNEAAWSGVQGYPRAVAIHEERLFFGGTTKAPLTIDGSRSSRRFEDFDPSQAEDDAALRYEIAGQINTIQWLKSDGNFLLAGTFGGLAFLGSGDESAPLTPTNVKANTGTSFGSSSIGAVEIHNSIQYVQKQGKRIYQADYDAISLKYSAVDLTVNNPDIAGDLDDDSSKFVEIATQEEPYVILYALRNDGQLAILVQENNQDVVAWGRFTTGRKSDGTIDSFKSIAVIPSAVGNDEVWVVVERAVGATTVKYVEYIENLNSETNYVDSAIKYSGTATTTVTGLSHLENEDVSILADGAAVAPQSVSSGTITLSTAASSVYVGKGFSADLEPMLINPNAPANGPQQTKTKRIHELAIRLYKTVGLQYGYSFDNLKDIPFRTAEMSMDTPIPLFGNPRAKDKFVAYNGSWGDANIALRSWQPLPCTIVSISPRLQTNDK
jgi:hypothetical protein